MCPEWTNSFEAFYTHLGPRPPGHQLNRIDNSKGYVPGNCEWTTARDNVNNRRCNRKITWMRKTRTLTQWAQYFGIKPVSLSARLIRSGWSVEKAFRLPYSRHNSGRPRKQNASTNS